MKGKIVFLLEEPSMKTLLDSLLPRIFATPDERFKPSTDVKRLVPNFQKISGARNIAQHLIPADNRSHSFQVFFTGMQRLMQNT
ncbi:MAG: hypothetical protein LBT71_08570 [Azoarcus sp.]|jgi:hypothetical protein|nr:hypothetical protein [Azoarcus sp.]